MKKLTLRHHESLESVLATASGQTRWRNPVSHQIEINDNWTMTPDFNAAMNLARNGWMEGMNRLDAALAKLAARRSFAERPVEVMDVAGAYPIAAIAAAGDPMSMVNPQPQESQRRPVVRLLVSVGASAAYSSNQIVNYGAAVCCLIQGIESTGMKVEIEILWPCRSTEDYALKAIIKRAEDLIEPSRVAFCLTHPSFMRRIMFSCLEQEPQLEQIFNGHYGVPHPSENLSWKESNQTFISGINVFPPKDSRLATAEACLTGLEPIVREALNKEGVHLPPLWGNP